MGFHAAKIEPNIGRTAAHRSLQTVEVDHDMDHRWPYGESTWRCPATRDEWLFERDILVSRWIDRRTVRRCEEAVSPSNRHVIGVALRATRLKFARGPHTIFDGIMPAGTLHIAGPSQPLAAEFYSPCDFIHFHVSSDYLRNARMLRASGQPGRRLI